MPYQSVYRQLLKRTKLYKFEAAILNFIRRKFQNISNQNDLIGSFKELWVELMEISKDRYERKALEFFDFISWIESKIENRPFAEIVKEKAMRKNF